MNTILVVDDEQELLQLISNHLSKNSYHVVTATSGTEALKVAFQSQPDLIILDVMLPALDGITICKRLRELTETPIIMLTALTEERMIVDALESGADDYITKPFGADELLARVRSILRRAHMGNTSLTPVVTIQNLVLDLARRQATVEGEVVDLTPTEFELLARLAKQPGKVVTHRHLLHEVWGPEYVDQLEYLRIYVRHLRNKIEANPSEPQLILNKRGIGYYLAEVSSH